MAERSSKRKAVVKAVSVEEELEALRTERDSLLQLHAEREALRLKRLECPITLVRYYPGSPSWFLLHSFYHGALLTFGSICG